MHCVLTKKQIILRKKGGFVVYLMRIWGRLVYILKPAEVVVSIKETRIIHMTNLDQRVTTHYYSRTDHSGPIHMTNYREHSQLQLLLQHLLSRY